MNPIALFRAGTPVPAQHRSNFRHLYLDMAWFAITLASSLSFVGVYAARLGGNAFQLGLLSVGPTLANLLFALPAGRWLERQPIDGAVFWTAVLHRLFYAVWAFLPLFLVAQGQIWALIVLTLVMHIPGSALSVGFNELFAESVPPDWRGHVAGVRNILLSAVLIVMSVVCGQILVRVPFPYGYQIVFGLGFFGSLMSTVHLFFIVPCPEDRSPPARRRRFSDIAWPRLPRRTPARVAARRPLLRTDKLQGSFGRMLAVVGAFHLAWYLPIPLFPLHYVNNIHLTDGEIGLGSSLFYAAALIGATQIAPLARRLSNKRLTAAGAMILSLFPLFVAAAHGLPLYLAANAAGGLGWSFVNGALLNRVLETVPSTDRTAYLGWYNTAINGAALAGVLIGPLLGGWLGLVAVIAISAVLRLLGGLAIWRWA